MKTDVLIVGGGPSGLAAAYEVASRGYAAIIVEDLWTVGGQMNQQAQEINYLPAPWTGLRGNQLIAALKERLNNLPVTILLEHEVVGLYADNCVGVRKGTEMFKIEAKCVVVATGAAEMAAAFPGWTLPGVMTVGAAQILINRERVYPGETGLVIGSNDLALEITRQMKAAGINILGVVEKSEQLQAKDKAIITSFQATDVPVWTNTQVAAVTGSGKAEEIALQAIDGAEAKYQVDFVCIDGGLQPVMDVAALFECPVTYEQALGGWVPQYDDKMQSVKGVFVAGQAAGTTCQAGVIITGGLAGIGAVDFIEQKSAQERDAARERYWNQLKTIEAENFPATWQARMAVINACKAFRE